MDDGETGRLSDYGLDYIRERRAVLIVKLAKVFTRRRKLALSLGFDRPWSDLEVARLKNLGVMQSKITAGLVQMDDAIESFFPQAEAHGEPEDP